MIFCYVAARFIAPLRAKIFTQQVLFFMNDPV